MGRALTGSATEQVCLTLLLYHFPFKVLTFFSFYKQGFHKCSHPCSLHTHANISLGQMPTSGSIHHSMFLSNFILPGEGMPTVIHSELQAARV